MPSRTRRLSSMSATEITSVSTPLRRGRYAFGCVLAGHVASNVSPRGTMSQRTFQDRAGVVWRVSEIPADADNAGEERERRDEPRKATRAKPRGKALETRPH